MDKKYLESLSKEELIEIILKLLPLAAEVERLTARAAELEERLNQNSGNSSKPPSSDGLAKPVSLRPKSNRSAGGQVGHKGHGHKIVRVDEIVVRHPQNCPECNADLKDEDVAATEIRYVEDLPKTGSVVTKYIFNTVWCPLCGAIVSASIPSEMSSTFTYGSDIRALAVVLTQYGMVSEDKTSKILSDVLNCNIGVGTIHSIIEECAEKSGSEVEKIRENMKDEPVLHADETGVRVKGKLGWFHVLSSKDAALYTVSAKRGKEGADESGVLKDYAGTLIHDCWQAYFQYDKCAHGLCNAHILRELKGISENDSAQAWCGEMTELLIEMKDVKARYQENDKTELSRYYKDKFHDKYAEIVSRGQETNPRADGKKQSKVYNLLVRLDKYREEFCRFAANFDVPFDNNQAERDVRPLKVKSKVSGCFRTTEGAKDHAAIATVIQSAVKQSRKVFTKVVSVFSGENIATSASA